MLLVEATIDNTLYRLSDESINVEHHWAGYIDSFDPVQYAMTNDHGGQCKLTFGNISILPSFYIDNSISTAIAKEIDIVIKYTATDESAAGTFFEGKGVLDNLTKESVSYNLYEDIRTVNCLLERTGYDATDEYDPDNTRITEPIIFGAVEHKTAVRLPDADNDDENPTYSLANLDNYHAKEVTTLEPYSFNPLTHCRVTCPNHGFDTSDEINVETNNFNGTYSITKINDDSFVIPQAYYRTKYYKAVTTRSANCDPDTASEYRVYLIANIASAYNIASIQHELKGMVLEGTSIDFFEINGPVEQITLQIITDNDLQLFVHKMELYECDKNYQELTYTNLITNYEFLKGDSAWNFSSNGWSHNREKSAAMFTSGGTGKLIQNIDLPIEYGHAYEDDQWRVYDDGVPIAGNIISQTDNASVPDNTFWLSATPVGEVTLSGTGKKTTLIDVFALACDENHLCLTLGTSSARDPSPVVAFQLSDQQLATEFLHDISSFYTHFFVISWLEGSRNVSIVNDSYAWEESTGTAGEYYLTNQYGYNPQKREPYALIENSDPMTKGTLGSLAAGEWAYGDNESSALEYNTIYVKLTDVTDPSTKADDYVEATFKGVLTLIDMETAITETSLDEFDFFDASYQMLPPISAFETSWVDREAVEESTGVFVKDKPQDLVITTNLSYGDRETVTSYHWLKSHLKAAIEKIILIVEKYHVTITIPFDAVKSTMAFGGTMTWTDTALYSDQTCTMYLRSWKFDFINQELTMEGEGELS